MPKAPTSAIGIDSGRHAFKAVALQSKAGGRLAVTSFASRLIGENADQDADRLAHHLKLLLKDLGASAKAYSIAVSSPAAILRIIEQPPTPPELLRHALRLNGLALLNQDCREFVLDCDLIATNPRQEAENGDAAEPPPDKKMRYLVGGLPRAQVTQLYEAFGKSRLAAGRLQLAPICTFNAFEHMLHESADPPEGFMLVDIGHQETRVLAGYRRELVLVRAIDYGGRHFLDAITADGAVDRETAIQLIEQGDAGIAALGHLSLAGLAHELRSSIGFFEGQREQTINRIYVSGSLVKAELPMQILADELEMPCELWDPFAHCDIAVSKDKRALFESERPHLNVACGAALEMLTPLS